ncbi:MAG: hypothetical protein JWM40_1855 [Frankiales bacterium]|nr:hypothetical protein [Frankiales bacterium]
MCADPTAPLVRGIRAGVLALPTVGGAAIAHVASGGCAPTWAIGVATAIAFPTAYAILAVRHRVTSLLLWVLATQVITHAVLDGLCFGGHTGTSARTTMLAAHAVAAIISASLLAHADAGLWIAQALLSAIRPAASPLKLPESTPSQVATKHAPKKGRWAQTPADPRGPPQLLAA